MQTYQAIGLRGGYLFNIRECTKDEALEILRDNTVATKLAFYPEGIKDVDMYLIDEKALLIVIPNGLEAEVHIACKFRDRKGLRDSLVYGIQWILAKGFESITTTAPIGRKGLINMIQSLGFRQDSGRWIYTWA